MSHTVFKSFVICKTVVIYALSLDRPCHINFLSGRFHPKAPASVLTSFCKLFGYSLREIFKNNYIIRFNVTLICFISFQIFLDGCILGAISGGIRQSVFVDVI